MFSSTSENIPCFDFMKNKGVLDTLPAMRPVAEWRPFSANWRFIHQPREPRGPLPSGGNSQPTRFPSSSPTPHGRGVGCRGTTPARAAVTPKSTFMSPEHPARLRQAVRRQGLRPWQPSERRFLPRSCPGAFRCLRRAQNARSARCRCSRRSPWRSRP